MPDISIVRHESVFDANKHKDQKFTIIGAGATGSRVFAGLVDFGVTNIDVYDFDTVESHNLANQIYFNSHIGMPKVDALASYYKTKTGQNPPDTMRFFNEKVTNTFGEPFSILFLLTDTMQSRKNISNAFLNSIDTLNLGPRYVIETRMRSAYGELYFFDPWVRAEAEKWSNTLFGDDDYPDEVSPCGTTISVGSTASLIASSVVWEAINHVNDITHIPQNKTLFCTPLGCIAA